MHVATGGIDLRFPGQWFQAESGLHQNWMRDYDPTTGRYIQADPLGPIEGASVYGYARQNPGRWTDPRGEFGIPGAVVGAILGGLSAYQNNPCWQNVVAGAAAGALVGAVTPGYFAAGRAFIGLGAAGAGQIVGNWATPDDCSCDRKDLAELLTSPSFYVNTIVGGVSAGTGSGVAGLATRLRYGRPPYFGLQSSANRFGLGAEAIFSGGLDYIGNLLGSTL